MSVSLETRLGRLTLANPIMTASGTFGYAREMAGYVDFSQLGGIIPKTITRQPRAGNPPPRTVETPSGLLNAIGLDNDGIDHFLTHDLPYLAELPTQIIVNIAGKTEQEFAEMAAMLAPHSGIAGLELNLSCPNVAGGTDFAKHAEVTRRIVADVRGACPFPILAKLTPNVTDIVPIVAAAADGGADAVSLVNTFLGMAIHWRKRKPVLGNQTGGLSGPAIKPMVLRLVWEVAKQNILPIVAIGGIANIDDVMEFFVAGASALQIGTANFYDPGASGRLLQEITAACTEMNITHPTQLAYRHTST